jgi:hypothetical protein
MTTNRFDIVIKNQRRLAFINVATMFAFVTTLGVSLLSLI